MIALRLRMRDQFRRRLRYLTIQDLDDPNRKYPDPNEGDKEFRKLRKKLIYNLEIQHVSPEQQIIMQSDEIRDEWGDFTDRALFYIILSGNFKVSSLRFNKRKKSEMEYSAADDMLHGAAHDKKAIAK